MNKNESEFSGTEKPFVLPYCEQVEYNSSLTMYVRIGHFLWVGTIQGIRELLIQLRYNPFSLRSTEADTWGEEFDSTILSMYLVFLVHGWGITRSYLYFNNLVRCFHYYIITELSCQ